jgi:surfactin synthase thioesterase subunit
LTDLRAGEKKVSAAESDCAADIAILRQTLPGKDYFAKNLMSETRHKYSRLHALSIIASLGTSKPIILCGHSLGGSLAMNAFIGCMEKYENTKFKQNIFYVGFNAALLGN